MSPKHIFRVHAVQRMFERNVSVKRVAQALQSGQTVEDYSTEMAKPSRLILGMQGNRPIHVVISENPEADTITVITVYVPDPKSWNKDFNRRTS